MTPFVMNSKHRKALEAIFSVPAPKNLTWGDLVSLMKALGCDMETQTVVPTSRSGGVPTKRISTDRIRAKNSSHTKFAMPKIFLLQQELNHEYRKQYDALQRLYGYCAFQR
jgi:hypothetical protein